MRRRRLDVQADRIEMVLASHRVPGRVWGGQVTPRFVRFQLTTGLGVKVNKVSQLAEEIALSLGVSSARVYRENGAIQVEVPLERAQAVRLLPLCGRLRPGSVPPVTAVLGVDEEGAPLLLRLASPDVVHVLVAGTTGSGKTALMRALLLSLALFNRQGMVQLVLVDPKGRGFEPLAGLPHVVGRLAGSAAEGTQALAWLVTEMERRDRERISAPAIVVGVDELADLLTVGGKGVEEALLRLAQRGREAGIHLVCCTQKPAAAVMSGVLKANFPVRLVGAVASADDARVAAGVAGTGAEKLLGRGDFLLVAKGDVVRFQAAYAGEADMARVVQGMRGGGVQIEGGKATELQERSETP
jgi:S-DNA-T family DNA segregation ATPase FtsK/SpoIIIE